MKNYSQTRLLRSRLLRIRGYNKDIKMQFQVLNGHFSISILMVITNNVYNEQNRPTSSMVVTEFDYIYQWTVKVKRLCNFLTFVTGRSLFICPGRPRSNSNRNGHLSTVRQVPALPLHVGH